MTAPTPSFAPAKGEWTVLTAVFGSYTALSLLLYRLALRGPILSDDYLYLVQNAYIQRFSLADILAILDPWGAPATNVAQYVPLDLLLHGVEWKLFGPNPLGYHVVNIVGHALVATLLVALLRSARLSWAGSLLGGTFFLVHPANVEAVAWMSQLKSIVSLALALSALLLSRARPVLATGAFVLSVLSKASGIVVLPVVAVQKWARLAAPRIGWIALWAGLFAVYSLPQLAAANRTGLAPGEVTGAPLSVRLRETASIIGRYSVMAATSSGTSVQHEPPLPRSWLDPWVVGGLVVVVVLSARTMRVLAARREEAAWWTFAAAGFAPVSQILPMVFPMSDRYLYFILPGVIGALLLAVSQPPMRLYQAVMFSRARLAPFALAAVGLAVLAARTHERAAVFASSEAYNSDAVTHYPNGSAATMLRAERAARAGDREAALGAIEALGWRGYNSVLQLQNDRSFDFVRDDPRFQAVVREGARFWIERIGQLRDPTPNELLTLASVYLAEGQPESAVAVLRRALVNAGPNRSAVLEELRQAEAATVRARTHPEEKPQAATESKPPSTDLTVPEAPRNDSSTFPRIMTPQ